MPALENYFQNGKAYGPMAQEFAGRDIAFDPGRMRPYLDDKTGVPCVTINTGRRVRDDNAPGGVRDELKQFSIEALRQKGIYIQTGNAVTVRRGDYAFVDRKLMEISRKQQKFVNELRRIGTVGVDGMKKMTYEYEAVSDYGEAIIDMDLMSNGRSDHPLLTNSSVPLPFTHFNVTRSARHLGVWSNSSPTLTDLDLKTAGIKIGETLENMGINGTGGINWGSYSTGPYPQRVLTGSGATIAGSKVYGALNHPARYTKINMTAPTGANPHTVYTEIAGLIQTMLNAKFRGPFVLYHSLDYDYYMNLPYAWTDGTGWAVNPTKILRQQIESIPDISRVERLEFFTGTTALFLLPDDSRYVGWINGHPQTTVQWPSKGGMQQNWITFEIGVPYMKFDYDGYLPIYHATIA